MFETPYTFYLLILNSKLKGGGNMFYKFRTREKILVYLSKLLISHRKEHPYITGIFAPWQSQEF